MTTTTKQAPTLTLALYIDGMDGYDLGMFGQCQYGLAIGPDGTGTVMRRIVSTPERYGGRSPIGLYGGWRWECDARHVMQWATQRADYAHIAPQMSAILAAYREAR